MKRLAAATVLAVLCMAFTLCAAEDAADFSGSWLLDSKKSDPSPIPVTDLGAPGEGGRGGMGGMGGGGFGGFGGGFPGAKSKAPQGPPVPMVIKQTEGEIQITSTYNTMPIVENFKLDGKAVVTTAPPTAFVKEEGKKKTEVELKKNKFVIEEKTTYSKSTNEVKKEYVLSKDGKVLTLKVKTMMQTGMMVNRTEQKLVYNKQ